MIWYDISLLGQEGGSHLLMNSTGEKGQVLMRSYDVSIVQGRWQETRDSSQSIGVIIDGDDCCLRWLL